MSPSSGIPFRYAFRPLRYVLITTNQQKARRYMKTLWHILNNTTITMAILFTGVGSVFLFVGFARSMLLVEYLISLLGVVMINVGVSTLRSYAEGAFTPRDP